MNLRLLLISLLLLPTLRGQFVFVVMDGETPKPVKSIYHGYPQVEENGKMVSKAGLRYGFRKAAIYGRGYVEFLQYKVTIHTTEMADNGSRINNKLEIECVAKTDTNLTNAYFVMQLNADTGSSVTYQELPDLAAGESRSLHLWFNLDSDVDKGKFTVHVFSNGMEIINSKLGMPPAEVERQRKKTDEFFALHSQPDHGPVAIEAKAPLYPTELEEQRIAGSAKIRCHITEHGDVIDAEIVEASQPYFGREAVRAVRMWKFQPAVKDHHYVEKTVIIPFNFSPPSTASAEVKPAAGAQAQ